ncbi:copper resistance protein CopC [Rhodopseudomonas boonkerdii]|uniref:copper homeostasis periplasmic binding protein CopC n=1 Tax=Rhodopseudomonas boonkerdii TaxID=475937 RepID=UPI001E54DF01|nr:copper homeostasis periplasmic binding protein CopC [Rhodopseudomonas boonkerdii]UGV24647.1 copper resistance protein CopC [Rhodopseudomonas boonkerdii]
MPKTIIAAAAFVAATLATGAALAHPEFQSAEPPAGKTSAAPKQIRILFNESVIPQFSGIELKDQAGKPVATGKTTVDPANKKLMIVPLKDQLAPGDYKVEWHAVSDDTHKVKGTYSFGVAR